MFLIFSFSERDILRESVLSMILSHHQNKLKKAKFTHQDDRNNINAGKRKFKLTFVWNIFPSSSGFHYRNI